MAKKEKREPDYYVVEFKSRRLDYFIERNHLGLTPEEVIIVQAEHGKDIGSILSVISKKDFENHSKHKYPLEILRRVSPDELEKFKEIRQREEEVIATTQELVDFRGMDMKLIDAEYQFDMNKLTIYFTADERVDFRELVKDLAATYRTRIELRQIGVRDEAKKMGGIGPCGFPLCCSRFLRRFEPVSTQMARVQNLAVNPSKISGLCERLMCCLTYELDYYEKIDGDYPKPGDRVKLSSGKVLHVDSVDYFNDKIRLKDIEEGEFVFLSLIDFRKQLANRKDFLKKWLSRKSPNDNSKQQ